MTRLTKHIFAAAFASMLALGAFALTDSAQADPYRWCAQYGSKGARNCYFATLQQCQAAVSGNGGFCEPNGFYDGRPVGSPDDRGRRVGGRAH